MLARRCAHWQRAEVPGNRVFRPCIPPGHRTAESPRDLAGRLAEADGETMPAAAGPREGRWTPAGRTKGPGTTAERRCHGRPRAPDATCKRCEEMGISYYDALLPVREPGAGLRAVLARIRLPYRELASVCVPGGRVVLAFVSDSALLGPHVRGQLGSAESRPGAGRDALCAGGLPAATGLTGSGTGAMVVAGPQDDGGLRIWLIQAGQGVRPGHLLGRERWRHRVRARMRAVRRRADWPTWRAYHGKFRCGEDDARGGPAAAS